MKRIDADHIGVAWSPALAPAPTGFESAAMSSTDPAVSLEKDAISCWTPSSKIRKSDACSSADVVAFLIGYDDRHEHLLDVETDDVASCWAEQARGCDGK